MLCVMQRIPLKSRAIVSAGYDADTLQLEIEFRGGRTYRYRDVPSGVFDFLLRTPHKGGYVNRMIHGRYAFENLSRPCAEQDLVRALEESLSERAARRE